MIAEALQCLRQLHRANVVWKMCYTACLTLGLICAVYMCFEGPSGLEFHVHVGFCFFIDTLTRFDFSKLQVFFNLKPPSGIEFRAHVRLPLFQICSVCPQHLSIANSAAPEPPTNFLWSRLVCIGACMWELKDGKLKPMKCATLVWGHGVLLDNDCLSFSMITWTCIFFDFYQTITAFLSVAIFSEGTVCQLHWAIAIFGR